MTVHTESTVNYYIYRIPLILGDISKNNQHQSKLDAHVQQTSKTFIHKKIIETPPTEVFSLDRNQFHEGFLLNAV